MRAVSLSLCTQCPCSRHSTNLYVQYSNGSRILQPRIPDRLGLMQRDPTSSIALQCHCALSLPESWHCCQSKCTWSLDAKWHIDWRGYGCRSVLRMGVEIFKVSDKNNSLDMVHPKWAEKWIKNRNTNNRLDVRLDAERFPCCSQRVI